MKGKVYLVGAGPGDPELLTLKAARVLRSADAVLHDDLVSTDVLSLIPRHARLHNVGKRCGDARITQDEINFLLVELAASGQQVVRLKGGDPLIFGRITEEIESLRSAKIDFEIIPGITSAMGAASVAEIPLTDRRLSHGVVFLAGHHLPGADPTNWEAVVALKTTVVIYMPGRQHPQIAGRLRLAGLPSHTPCALISRATTPDEKVHLTTVRDLKRAPHLPGPTLLVIGDVLRFAKGPTWLDKPAACVSDTFPASIPNLESDSVEDLGTRGSTI